jgi:hypothetical protein
MKKMKQQGYVVIRPGSVDHAGFIFDSGEAPRNKEEADLEILKWAQERLKEEMSPLRKALGIQVDELTANASEQAATRAAFQPVPTKAATAAASSGTTEAKADVQSGPSAEPKSSEQGETADTSARGKRKPYF